MDFIEIIEDMFASASEHQITVNPTQIYNEGWLVRALTHFSIKHGITLKGLAFGSITNWTSEGLIGSPFVGKKAPHEGYTHADIALGDFSVDYETGGEITVDETPDQFGIIEAKLGSPLSKGTKYADYYDQAARNAACIAYQTFQYPECKSFFIVTAPKNQKHFRKIQELNSVESIITKVERRFEEFRSVRGTYNSRNDILSAIERISLDVISYEDWIEHFDQFKEIQQLLLAFYQNTLKYNLKLSKYE
jgi:hypothetical protein